MRKIFYSLAIVFGIFLTVSSIQESFAEENRTYTLEEALEIQRLRTGMDESIYDSESEYPIELTAEDVKCMQKMGHAMRAEKNMAPRWQVLCYNFAIDEIRCNDGLQLIFKLTDDSPACVKPNTAEKLIERG